MAGTAERQERLLTALGLPRRAPGAADPERVLDLTATEKKSSGGSVRWVLLERLGWASGGHAVPRPVALAAARAVLED